MELIVVAVFFVVINLAACVAMMFDKSYAVKNKWRLSERFLLSFSFFGGGIGLMMGMIFSKHKLSKLKFKVIPTLGICIYVATFLYFVWIGKIVWV